MRHEYRDFTFACGSQSAREVSSAILETQSQHQYRTQTQC